MLWNMLDLAEREVEKQRPGDCKACSRQRAVRNRARSKGQLTEPEK